MPPDPLLCIRLATLSLTFDKSARMFLSNVMESSVSCIPTPTSSKAPSIS
jgi:hypothetical protein